MMGMEEKYIVHRMKNPPIQLTNKHVGLSGIEAELRTKK